MNIRRLVERNQSRYKKLKELGRSPASAIGEQITHVLDDLMTPVSPLVAPIDTIGAGVEDETDLIPSIQAAAEAGITY